VKLDLSFVPDSEEVSGIVASAIVPRLIEETQAKLKSGQAADFGCVKMRSDGLESGGKTLGWRDIAEYNVDNGYLTIKALKGWSAWLSKSLDEIPNFRVLVAFLEHYRTSAPQPGGDSSRQQPELAAR
jgi:hypothetical protein